jgi:hypothetical protein
VTLLRWGSWWTKRLSEEAKWAMYFYYISLWALCCFTLVPWHCDYPAKYYCLCDIGVLPLRLCDGCLHDNSIFVRSTILPVGLTKLLVETKLCGLLPVGLTKLLVETKLCGLLPIGLTKLLVETKLCGLLLVGLTKLLVETMTTPSLWGV